MWAREDARDKGGCGAGVDQAGALEEGEEPVGVVTATVCMEVQKLNINNGHNFEG